MVPLRAGGVQSMTIFGYTLPGQNITVPERALRVALGVVLVAVMIAGSQQGLIGDDPGAFLLWGLVLTASLDLVISGAIGYCPLYHWIYFPWALRDHPPRVAGPPDAKGTRGKRLRLLAFPGDGAAVQFGLIVENAVRRYGPIPLWLDRPLDIAPELGLEMDYVRISALIVDAAGSLTAAGVSAGDYVAIIKRDNMDVFVLAAAASRLGAVPALLSPTLRPAAMDELLARLSWPLVIADRAAIQSHRLLGHERRVVVVDGVLDGAISLNGLTAASSPLITRAPDDVAVITHTSGTTGVPKLCMHTGRSLAGQACVQIIAHKVFLTRRDVFATCPTAIHARVLSGWHALLAVGCGHVALFEPDPETTATFLSRYRPTVVDTFPNLYTFGGSSSPTMQEAHSPTSASSSRPFDAVHPRTIQRLLTASKRRFPLWVQGYAQSEVGLATLKCALATP